MELLAEPENFLKLSERRQQRDAEVFRNKKGKTQEIEDVRYSLLPHLLVNNCQL